MTRVNNTVSLLLLNCRLANSGSEWAEYFSEYNSGTYNDEWMVADYKKLPVEKSQNGVLWLVDQIPGQVMGEDVSMELFDNKYFASYNRPYFMQVRHDH